MVVDVVQNPQTSNVYEDEKNTYVVLASLAEWCMDVWGMFTSSSGGFRLGVQTVVCLKSWKTSAVSTTVWIVETQLCRKKVVFGCLASWPSARKLRRGPFMDDEWVTIRNRNKAVFTVRPVWVTNGCRSAAAADAAAALLVNSSATAIWWMLYRTLTKVTYEYEKKTRTLCWRL